MRRTVFRLLMLFAIVVALPRASQAGDTVRGVVAKYCISCHASESPKGELNLASVVDDEVTSHPVVWEKVVRQLRGRQMPPLGKKRPDEQTYSVVVRQLEADLDRAATQRPAPGRTETIRRLSRTEYQNAIRDLLDLEVNAAAWLPADDSGHGFDNGAVGELSPTLLDRYITAAQRISKLAVGGTSRTPGGETFRVRADITQEDRVDGLPFGTRGGTVIRYTFPQDGQYDIQVRLARDRNEQVEGLRQPHELELLLDRDRQASFTVMPPPDQNHERVDEHLQHRLTAKAGLHEVGVTFVKQSSSLLETSRQPYQSHFNTHRHPRLSPAVFQVTITGPFNATGPGETASRRRIFNTYPKSAADEDSSARRILSTLMRRAYRRNITESDLVRVLALYHATRTDEGFEAGIEVGLSAILVSPEFLLRIEQEPTDVVPHTAYHVSDWELASRLSFFLWSSIPDDELLDVAERGELQRPNVLEQQARRMLLDPRSRSLVTSFAAQWLYLRNLDSITPDGRLFPDFDDNLRQSLRRETELLCDEVLSQDRSVLELLHTDHTWLNERLAKHYGVPHVFGSRFRRVSVDSDSPRGGLLGQGSILTVTSYATRTSPVLRGKWILENLLGSPPPPPPANVPALEENTVSSTLLVRERLALHRENAACASCHDVLDPVGFSLENFDAVGRWRLTEENRAVDATGGLPDGSQFEGVHGLKRGLLARPEIFVGTLTEKLMTFALGRGVEPTDGPAVRQIVRQAREKNYRFSELILGIVQSVPFRMRTRL